MTNGNEIPKIVKIDTIVPITGREFTSEEKAELIQRGILEEFGARESAQEPVRFVEVYEDLQNNIRHEGYCYCASCLYWIYRRTHKRSKIRPYYFFFGWLLFQIATVAEYRFVEEKPEEIQLFRWLSYLSKEFNVELGIPQNKADKSKRERKSRTIRFNWRLASDWMYQLTSPSIRFYYDSLKRNQRHQIRKTGIKYVMIVMEAYVEKFKFDFVYGLPYMDAKARGMVLGKAFNLATRILTYLEETRALEGKFMFTQREILRVLTRERRDTLDLPLGILENCEEIYRSRDGKKILYIGKDKGGKVHSNYILNAMINS